MRHSTFTAPGRGLVRGPVHGALGRALVRALVLAFVGGGFADPSRAGEDDGVPGVPGVETMARNCSGCHGEDGRSPGSIPSLAGRPVAELATRLGEFKSGHRPSTIMKRIITPFGEAAIQELAEWFAAQEK